MSLSDLSGMLGTWLIKSKTQGQSTSGERESTRNLHNQLPAKYCYFGTNSMSNSSCPKKPIKHQPPPRNKNTPSMPLIYS
jgi:hypothetical protein